MELFALAVIAVLLWHYAPQLFQRPNVYVRPRYGWYVAINKESGLISLSGEQYKTPDKAIDALYKLNKQARWEIPITDFYIAMVVPSKDPKHRFMLQRDV